MTMDITKSVAFTGHRSERILQVRMLYLYLDIVSQVKRLYSLGSVSYTHLTLPTNSRV